MIPSSHNRHWADEALIAIAKALPYAFMVAPVFIIGDTAARWSTLPAADLLSEHARSLGAVDLSAVQRYAGFVLTVLMGLPVHALLIAGGIALLAFIQNARDGEVSSERIAWSMVICLYLTPVIVIVSALVPPVIDIITTYGIASPEDALRPKLLVALLAMTASLAVAIFVNLEVLKTSRETREPYVMTTRSGPSSISNPEVGG